MVRNQMLMHFTNDPEVIIELMRQKDKNYRMPTFDSKKL